MALPQSDYPLTEIEIISTKEKVQFRPFLVKEEKLLVMATQSETLPDIVKGIQQVITNCSFGKVNGDELPIFDVQNIFLKLRAFSITETFGVKYNCGSCLSLQETELNLNEFKIEQNDSHVNPVMVKDGVAIEFNYPTAEMLAGAGKIGKEATEKDFKDVYFLSEACLKAIITADEVTNREDLTEEEIQEFFENMTTQEFNKVKEFFETIPVCHGDFDVHCNACEETNKLYMNGYLDFFV